MGKTNQSPCSALSLSTWPSESCSNPDRLLPKVRHPPAPPGPGAETAAGDTRDRASGHREPHRDCWVPRLRAQIRNALSSGWKRDVRLQDLLLYREGRHEVRCCRETTKDPTGLSPAPWGPSQMLEACCGLPREDSLLSWEEGPSWSLGAAPSAGDRDTHHSR